MPPKKKTPADEEAIVPPEKPVKKPAAAKKTAPAAAAEEAIVPPAPAVVEPAAPVAPRPIVPPAPVTPVTPPAPAISDKPGMVTAVAVLTLISGIVNILWMLSIGVWILVAGISTFGLGCLLLPVVIPPVVLGIFEIIYAAKLLPTPIKPTQPSQTLAILEIACILTGNIIPVVAGILALVFYGDERVKAYFARYGSQA